MLLLELKYFMPGLSLWSSAAVLTIPLRLILGITLIIAGLEKVRNPQAFVTGVVQYQILPAPLVRWYGRLLPLVEIDTGALLFSGIWIRPAAAVSAMMFISFSIAVGVNLARNRRMPCFCFGADSSEIGWHTLARIFLLATASFSLISFPTNPDLLWRLVFGFSIPLLIDFIPVVLITAFGLLLLSLIEVSPLVVRAWTSRAIRPANYRYSVVWTKHSEEDAEQKS